MDDFLLVLISSVRWPMKWAADLVVEAALNMALALERLPHLRICAGTRELAIAFPNEEQRFPK